MLALTLFSLFGYDFRLAFFTQDSDPVFSSLSLVCLCFFLLELSLYSLLRPDYLLSFYFWLDFVSCLSMLTDVSWIWDSIIGDTSMKGTGLVKSSQIVRAARGSRAGTRVSRIFSVIRVVRLVRAVRQYRLAQERKIEPDEDTDLSTNHLNRSVVIYRGTGSAVAPALLTPAAAGQPPNVDMWEKGEGKVEEQTTYELFSNNSYYTTKATRYSSQTSIPLDVSIPIESRVGHELTDRISKRIISIVLAMLFFLPLFTPSAFRDDNSSYDYALRRLDLTVDTPAFDQAWSSFITLHESLETPLAYVEVVGVRRWQQTAPEELREEERRVFQVGGNVGSRYYTWAVADLRPVTKVQAGVNILKTVFLCVVLAGSAFFFSKDAHVLVLSPLELMYQKIRRMAENPLETAQQAELDTLIMEKTRKPGKWQDVMETDILEKVIVKIGTLLVLGFGEAGAEVIASNMQRGGGDIDPIVAGKKIDCIFGFCGIVGYSELAEVLQEDVLHYVNDLAFIVHRTVHRFLGAANKNMGDSFFLVWKLPSSLPTSDDPVPYELTQLADMALIAFLKVIAALSSDHRLKQYTADPRIQAAFDSFTVRMTFGLHVGWAIEGTIGSEFKVEASYLSPNVNLTSRLHTAARQFGVPILFSGSLFDLMSAQTQSRARQIDCVRVKGSRVPIRLYTVDLHLSSVPATHEETAAWGSKRARLQRKRRREKLWESVTNQWEEAWRLLETDPQLIALLRDTKGKFTAQFGKGLEAYQGGDWGKARRELTYALEVKGEADGPVQALLAFIEGHHGACPLTWGGHRELIEK